MTTSVIAHFRSRSLYFMIGIAVLLFSCKGAADKSDDDDKATVNAQTPVTVTTVNDSAIVDYIDLNATSAFLQKSYVKANANGYIQKAATKECVVTERGRFLARTSRGNAITK